MTLDGAEPRRGRAGPPPGGALGRRVPFGGSAAVGMEPELGLRSRCGVPAAHVARICCSSQTVSAVNHSTR